jgi:hypothetical protein
MRHMRSLLLSLVLLPCSIGAVAAENVCVQAADGAIVCGPVAAQHNNNAAPNPFDQPAQGIAQPNNPMPPAAAPKPLRAPPVREATRDVRPPPPKHVYRQQPPRELDRRPPAPRRLAREDVRQREAERDPPPPRRVERERPIRYSDAERRRREINNERPLPRVDRNVVASRYDSRLRELEREVHALRAEREIAMRRSGDRRPPPRDLRRDERERYAVSQRPPRRAARERYSDEN